MLRNYGTDFSAFKLAFSYVVFQICVPSIYTEGRSTVIGPLLCYVDNTG